MSQRAELLVQIQLDTFSDKDVICKVFLRPNTRGSPGALNHAGHTKESTEEQVLGPVRHIELFRILREKVARPSEDRKTGAKNKYFFIKIRISSIKRRKYHVGFRKTNILNEI